MSVQNDHETVHNKENVRKEKNARFELRINSDFKEELREEAKKKGLSLSEYLLDIVRTRNGSMSVQSNNKCTDKTPKIFKLAFKELFFFLFYASRSELLKTKRNYDLWNVLLDQRNIDLIEKAEELLEKEGLLLEVENYD